MHHLTALEVGLKSTKLTSVDGNVETSHPDLRVIRDSSVSRQRHPFRHPRVSISTRAVPLLGEGLRTQEFFATGFESFGLSTRGEYQGERKTRHSCFAK